MIYFLLRKETNVKEILPVPLTNVQSLMFPPAKMYFNNTFSYFQMSVRSWATVTLP